MVYGSCVNTPETPQMAVAREVVEDFVLKVMGSQELTERCAVCVLHSWPGRPSGVLAPDTQEEYARKKKLEEERRKSQGVPDGEPAQTGDSTAAMIDNAATAAPCSASEPLVSNAPSGAGAAPVGAAGSADGVPGAPIIAWAAPASVEPSSRPPVSPMLDSEVIKTAAAQKTVVLVPCTFEDEREAAVARVLMPILKRDGAPARILMVQLFLPGAGPGPQTNDMLLRRHEAMLASMPHAVLLNPPTEPRALADAIEIQCAVDEQSERRMQGALDAEVPAISQEEIQTLRQEQERLLWNEIPSVLMQALPQANPNLNEGLNSVSDLTFLRRLAARSGTVYEAARPDNPERFAVKVIEKETVTSPGLLEGHYRELILLSRTLDHANISKCLEVLHSQTRLYYVFRFAGDKNLAQALEMKPHWRFPTEETMVCFGQVCTGMAYCHDRNVALRDLAPEHVVSRQGENGQLHWTLVDFRSSLITQGNNTSSVMCGSFPHGPGGRGSAQNYIPRMADRWSLGVLLLEMSAGLGIMDISVQWVGVAIDANLAGRVTAFFRDEAAPEKCCSMVKLTPDETILGLLKSLLRVAPDERAELAAILRGMGLEQPPQPVPQPQQQQGQQQAQQQQGRQQPQQHHHQHHRRH